MTASAVDSLIWFSDHLHLLGWPALVGVVWKLKDAIDKYLSGVNEVKVKTAATEQVALQIKTSLETVQSNHLAHLAQDVKEVGATYEKHTELLQNIDKNIGLLVDRGLRQ